MEPTRYHEVVRTLADTVADVADAGGVIQIATPDSFRLAALEIA
jgi:hypothetical protein